MNPRHIEAATTAYAAAEALDPQMPAADLIRLQAWADLFVDDNIGPAEALAAVKDFYRQPQRFPIKPGDIIARVRRMPVTSSPERIRAFIDRWSDHPYSDAISRITGMTWTPPYPPPADIDRDDPDALRAYHRAAYKTWIATHRAELEQRALAHGEQLELTA
ncbi:hypothetical protein [Nocardia pseudobrasiliensis]|uniref:Uncharacterized protein n=1 Tax=Nocardia pseudobrasiliensis TaxID=45979 RepID=A0A370I532_9NOCA|nr:hypothetical protein [Nocardia pseudobrasiliensis]RDI65710.1 hypothetical protein DFR76_10525 [Nocardia pseudobrasiliensis]